MITLLLFGLFALGISFLCSLLEATLLSLPNSYVESLAQTGSRTGQRLRDMKQNLDMPLAAILSLNTVAHTIGAAGVGGQAARLWGSYSVGVASAVMTLLVLLLSEILPKTLGAVHAKALAGFAATTIRLLVILVWPLAALTRLVGRLVRRNADKDGVDRGELVAALGLGRDGGQIAEDEHRMAANVLALDEVRAADILTPRTVVLTFDEGRTIDDVLGEHRTIPYARIPVHDKDHEITGYVTRADLLTQFTRGRASQSLKQLRRRLVVVPELASVRAALRLMLAHGQHILMAVDEYGGFAGVVTLEDTVETLLGVEITDETDQIVDLQAHARHRATRQPEGK